jgi:hypothetical protein
VPGYLGYHGARMESTVLELRLAPEWEAILAAWEPCSTTLSRAGLSDDERASLCMVTRELLENAVKYGGFGEGEAVELTLRASRDDVIIEVRNPLHGVAPEQLRMFDQAIQWIRGYQDPFEAYVERMKALSSEPYHEGKSGLGLTRIAYEGRSIVDFYVAPSNQLAVSAVYLRGGEAGA